MIELLSKRTSLEIEEAVEELLTALAALYSRMLRRIPSGKLDSIITILHWVTLAVRPLSIDELEYVVTWNLPERMDRRQALRDYVKLCEPILVVQQDRVLLVHQSARDYFLRHTKDDDMLAERVRASFADAQASLAKTCLRALDKLSSLSGYARSYWPQHVSSCSESTQSSLVKNESFFGRSSASRDYWWKQSILYQEEALFGMPPRLNIACHVGLVVWAQQILAEVSSLQQNRTIWISVPFRPKDASSAGRQRDNVNYRFGSRSWTPLHHAIYAENGHGIVSFLLKSGADPNFLKKGMVSPLAMAVQRGSHLDTLKLLLAAGADPDGGFKSNDSVLSTPLRRAVELRREESALFLIASGADIRAADHVRRSQCSSLTLLQLAASTGLVAVVESLLERGADPQVAQGGSPIPLCLAMMRKKTEVVDLMLDGSASITTFHDSCVSWPLYTALTCRDIGLAQRIVRFEVTRSEFPTETLDLWAAILDSRVAEVTSALNRGVSPNKSTPSSPGSPRGLTSLHWAVVEWQRQGYNTFTLEQYGAIARRLLEHGADSNLRDADGKTALQRAEAKGRVWAAVASLVARTGARVGSSLAGCKLDLLRTGGRRG